MTILQDKALYSSSELPRTLGQVADIKQTIFTKEELSRLIADAEPAFASLLSCEAKTAKEVVAHLFASGGKRVRPLLFLLSARLCGYEGEHLNAMAAVCEYIHSASLLHDDVVDDSRLRRGKATAHTLWGDKQSILVGDLIYARASELMAQTGNLDVVEAFARAIRLMSEGELLQMDHAFDLKLTQKQYEKIIYYKTAALLEAICFSAAALAGCSTEQQNALKLFGYATGMAFQIIDDSLDYTEHSTQTGKERWADLREGKVTLPLILAITSTQDFTAVGFDSNGGFAEAERLQKLVAEHNTIEKSMKVAESFTQQAKAALNSFEQSSEKEVLLAVVDILLGRRF